SRVPALDVWLVATRTGHFLACILLFGEALYVHTIDPQARLRVRVMLAAVLAAFVSALAWLGIEAIMMSGEASAQALRAQVLATVLRSTQFGHVWAIRVCGAVLVAIVAWTAVHARTPDARRIGL